MASGSDWYSQLKKTLSREYLWTSAGKAVDKRYPEVAAIRANIYVRQNDLYRAYGSELFQRRLSAEGAAKLASLKAAWAQDFSLMQRRDMEQVDHWARSAVVGSVVVLSEIDAMWIQWKYIDRRLPDAASGLK